jgi:hypothetical protein
MSALLLDVLVATVLSRGLDTDVFSIPGIEFSKGRARTGVQIYLHVLEKAGKSVGFRTDGLD